MKLPKSAIKLLRQIEKDGPTVLTVHPGAAPWLLGLIDRGLIEHHWGKRYRVSGAGQSLLAHLNEQEKDDG